MHNTFINRHFDWQAGGSRPVSWANRLLRALGKSAYVRAPGSTGFMTSRELRINLYHLVSQVLGYHVPGDFIEVGCFTGQTAAMIAMLLRGEADHERALHVYDSFEALWNDEQPLETLRRNFSEHQLALPRIHKGWFSETIPQELPDRIAFVHIDCGAGGDPKKHEDEVYRLLGEIYPRMAPGAVCSIVDYVDLRETPNVEHLNPGVKPAVDRFLSDKHETLSIMFAAEYGHAYFRKDVEQPLELPVSAEPMRSRAS